MDELISTALRVSPLEGNSLDLVRLRVSLFRVEPLSLSQRLFSSTWTRILSLLGCSYDAERGLNLGLICPGSGLLLPALVGEWPLLDDRDTADLLDILS